MTTYHYEGPQPTDLDGVWGCPVEGCTKGPDGGRYISDTELGVKQHITRSHREVMGRQQSKLGRPKNIDLNGHAEDMFKVMAKVTQALVADAPHELYERMEEIVEVRKMVARYLGKRYM